MSSWRAGRLAGRSGRLLAGGQADVRAGQHTRGQEVTAFSSGLLCVLPLRTTSLHCLIDHEASWCPTVILTYCLAPIPASAHRAATQWTFLLHGAAGVQQARPTCCWPHPGTWRR